MALSNSLWGVLARKLGLPVEVVLDFGAVVLVDALSQDDDLLDQAIDFGTWSVADRARMVQLHRALVELLDVVDVTAVAAERVVL